MTGYREERERERAGFGGWVSHLLAKGVPRRRLHGSRPVAGPVLAVVGREISAGARGRLDLARARRANRWEGGTREGGEGRKRVRWLVADQVG